jgi:predicted O-linked N-acetylglucosamine transferase (SPINDLY family)
MPMERFLDILWRNAKRAGLNVSLIDSPALQQQQWWYRSKASTKRLRVGNVSSDLGSHTLAT